MKDYTAFYKDSLPVDQPIDLGWTLFLSAFNPSQRVQDVFQRVVASGKHWLLHNEYSYPLSQRPDGSVFTSASENEAEFIIEFVETKLAGVDLSGERIAVDITGFMRPHIMFLVKLLVSRGVKRIDALYSEPTFYASKEKTEFSLGSVNKVRQVVGFEGLANTDTTRDFLIIGAGYETHLIAEVAEDKDKANKIVLLGLPSLSCDMYQQNALRTMLAADSIGESIGIKYFAPANDPFATAGVLSEIIDRENKIAPITNLYLSPLATKAQTLGFALFYLKECQGTATSIIFPFSSRYSSEGASGLARLWRYQLEFA